MKRARKTAGPFFLGVFLVVFLGAFLEVCLEMEADVLEDVAQIAQFHAAAKHRSIPKQIEYWARLGKVVEDNPDMPLQFIQDTLLSIEEAKVGQRSEYQFDA